MATDDRFSFDAGQFTVPRDTDVRAVVAASQGTYRSNWSRLKTAAYSTTYCCIVNMNSKLLPLATRICENNSHAAERAFLLSMNHGLQVGGPALGAISLVAFAQESFVRLSYQVAAELRLQRSRLARAKGLDRMVASALADFEKQTFAVRCRRLLEELRASAPRDALKPSIDLMAFRNSIAHDTPLLSTSTGREQTMVRGSPRERPTRLGGFVTLESEVCPVRLRHVKASIDAHDHLVDYCFRHSPGHGGIQ